MKVFSYIRVSGRGQVGGEGPDRQRETCQAFCAGHKLEHLGEFFESVSGTVDGMDRPEFASMIEGIVNRRLNGIEVDGFIVERMDRLARDLMVQEVLLKQCRENNIKVFAADRGELLDLASDDGDPTRTLIRQVMGALAQWEKSQIVMKLRKARQAIRAKTGRCEGPKPLGKNAAEQLTIKVLKLFVRPGHSLQDVADILNENGCVTRAGNKFKQYSARRALIAAGVYLPPDPMEYRRRNLGINSQPQQTNATN